MMILELLTFLMLVLVGYAYVGYPLLLWCYSFLLGRKSIKRLVVERGRAPAVTIIIAARNEEKVLREKLANTLALNYPEREKVQIIVASDQSEDRTDSIALEFSAKGVELAALQNRGGKEQAQKVALQVARGEIILFTDARSMLADDALVNIVSYFDDVTVGAVSSVDQIEKGEKESGESLYVRYEMWLRRLESEVGSVVGLSGSCFAVRRELFVRRGPEAGVGEGVSAGSISPAIPGRLRGFGRKSPSLDFSRPQNPPAETPSPTPASGSAISTPTLKDAGVFGSISESVGQSTAWREGSRGNSEAICGEGSGTRGLGVKEGEEIQFRTDVPSDFYMLLRCRELGLRGVHGEDVICRYRSVETEEQEFQRKVRTVLRGITTMFAYGEVLNPMRYGIFSLQIWSHKVCRWLVPWFIVVGGLSCLLLSPVRPWCFLLLILGGGFFTLAFVAFYFVPLRKILVFKVPLYFAVVNGAIVVAWWKFLSGRRTVRWDPTSSVSDRR